MLKDVDGSLLRYVLGSTERVVYDVGVTAVKVSPDSLCSMVCEYGFIM